MNLLNEMEEYAVENNVPIINQEGLLILKDLILVYKPKSILEIGTAIGYSGTLMLENAHTDATLDTIEKMEENGIMLPVVSMSLNFKKSARYDDLINVKTQLKNPPTAKIEFDYEITSENGEVIALANVVLAFIDMKTNRPVRAPQYILDVIND